MVEPKSKSIMHMEDIFGGSSDLSELSEDENLSTIRVWDQGKKTFVEHEGKEKIGPRRSTRGSLNAFTSVICISRPESLPSIRESKKRAASTSSGPAAKRTKIRGNQTSSFTSKSPASRSPVKFANIYDTDQVVWVRLDAQGFAVDNNIIDDDLTYWWPGKVTSADPLRISIKLIGSDGHGPRRCISIGMPSPCTVLPFKDGDKAQFTADNFFSGCDRSNQSELPLNIISRWLKACDKAREMEKKDEFPDVLDLVNSTESGTRRNQSKDGETAAQTASSPLVRRRARTPLDDSISFGHEDGELVLARDHKNRADHWPARVIGVSQDERTRRWLYELRYIDETYKKVDRSTFFTSEEQGFATCQVGRWETIVPIDDSEPDTDDEFHGRSDSRSRSPSPISDQVEDIHDLDAFRHLSITEQLRYVYPFLCQIIRREYEPVLDRHEAFMKGGKAREFLAETAGKGHFSDNEVKKVRIYVRKMMLRDDRWAKRVHDHEYCQELSAQRPSSCIESEKREENALQSGTLHIYPSQVSLTSPLAAVADHVPPNENESFSSDKTMEIDRMVLGVLPNCPANKNDPVLSHSSLSRRPVGCEEYEALAPPDRTMYCTDVLIPEAIIQLHLFRAGYRKSTKLLSRNEEIKLHRRGVALVEENKIHWALRVMELRKMAESRHNKRVGRKGALFS